MSSLPRFIFAFVATTWGPAAAMPPACSDGAACSSRMPQREHLMLQARSALLKKAGNSACWASLEGLAVDEGESAGGDLTNKPSTDECKVVCDGNAACESFSICPEWHGCWMKTKRFSGGEQSRERGSCKTFYKRPCDGHGGSEAPVPAPAPSTCWGELSSLAAEEGESVGGDLSSSPSTDECKAACSGNSLCQSFSSCPQWHGCWMKRKSFSGGELTKHVGSCKTFYKRPCDTGNGGAPEPEPTPAPPPASPTPPPAPALALTCWNSLSALAADEGDSAGGDLTSGPSIDDCKAACDGNADCKSFSSCPQWQGCWMKKESFTGSESTRQQGACKTFYKISCDGVPAPAPATPRPTPALGAHTIKVVSYNIYWWNAFNTHPWKGVQICQNIKDTLQPDVLGVQECDDPWHVQRQTGLQPASQFSGAQGTFVKSSLFTVGETGSQDIRATGHWGPRYVTYAQITHKPSGRVFWHFNTHWCVHSCDWRKRYVGAQNMLDTIRNKAGDAPVIITGDFNMFNGFLEEAGPKHFLQNGFSCAIVQYVDAIFHSTQHWNVLSEEVGDMAGSDHWPIIAELGF